MIAIVLRITVKIKGLLLFSFSLLTLLLQVRLTYRILLSVEEENCVPILLTLLQMELLN
jgi:hypothetical protein